MQSTPAAAFKRARDFDQKWGDKRLAEHNMRWPLKDWSPTWWTWRMRTALQWSPTEPDLGRDGLFTCDSKDTVQVSDVDAAAYLLYGHMGTGQCAPRQRQLRTPIVHKGRRLLA